MSLPIGAHLYLKSMWRVFAIMQLGMRCPKERLLEEHADGLIHTEAAKGSRCL